MSEIIKGKLYLGDILDANNKSFIEEKKITSIICVAKKLKLRKDLFGVKVYNFDFEDNEGFDIINYFHEISNLIDRNKTVLVSCNTGISRSSTVVIAYMMKFFDLSLQHAFIFVKKSRQQICPKIEFIRQLMKFELQLYCKNSVTYEFWRKMKN